MIYFGHVVGTFTVVPDKDFTSAISWSQNVVCGVLFVKCFSWWVITCVVRRITAKLPPQLWIWMAPVVSHNPLQIERFKILKVMASGHIEIKNSNLKYSIHSHVFIYSLKPRKTYVLRNCVLMLHYF